MVNKVKVLATTCLKRIPSSPSHRWFWLIFCPGCVMVGSLQTHCTETVCEHSLLTLSMNSLLAQPHSALAWGHWGHYLHLPHTSVSCSGDSPLGSNHRGCCLCSGHASTRHSRLVLLGTPVVVINGQLITFHWAHLTDCRTRKHWLGPQSHCFLAFPQGLLLCQFIHEIHKTKPFGHNLIQNHLVSPTGWVDAGDRPCH